MCQEREPRERVVPDMSDGKPLFTPRLVLDRTSRLIALSRLRHQNTQMAVSPKNGSDRLPARRVRGGEQDASPVGERVVHVQLTPDERLRRAPFGTGTTETLGKARRVSGERASHVARVANGAATPAHTPQVSNNGLPVSRRHRTYGNAYQWGRETRKPFGSTGAKAGHASPEISVERQCTHRSDANHLWLGGD